ncbi:MAG: RsfS/YbeB/iojap family protein, partial [Eubacteriales bacterium]|nr:RsfS/YbeB/iojap family protein [Eubacteriales bacterium]
MTDTNQEKNIVPANAEAAAAETPAPDGGRERAAELARIAIAALEDKKGEDVRVIDIGDVSVIADYFIIATGRNRT